MPGISKGKAFLASGKSEQNVYEIEWDVCKIGQNLCKSKLVHLSHLGREGRTA